MHGVGRLTHAFLATGDDDVGIAHPDRLEAKSDGAQPGTAELIDAIGGFFNGDASVARRLTSRVLSGSRRQHLTQYDLGYLTRLDTRALQRLADRDLAQRMGGQGAQRAVK